MRLICGLVRLDDAPADAAVLAAMVAALGAPGLSPRVVTRTDGPAALAVLDFARTPGPDALPRAPDGTWLAADLRLDRPRALAAALDLPAGTAAEHLALAGLGRWGEDAPDRLDGDFALAAWTPERRRLICARDIMGVRPLCYTYRPGRLFAFASLPRGLHRAGVAAARPDAVALGRLLIEQYGQDEATGFQDIAWLLAGHSLTLTPEGLRLHRAWRPDPAAVGGWRGSAAEAAETLRTLVTEAVVCRLPPTGPVAAHLSGGLDSSALAVLAARALRADGRRLIAGSILARPRPGLALHDEREYIEAVLAQEPDILWTSVSLPALDGDGFTDPDLHYPGAILAVEAGLCAAAAAGGAQLLLSGAGGDEGATYSGGSLYFSVLKQGRLFHVLAELRARSRRERISLFRQVVRRLIRPWLSEGKLPWHLPSPGAVERRKMALELMTPALAARVLAATPDWARDNRPPARIRRFTQSYLVGRGDHWTMVGAHYGLALTYPLLDRRIIDFALSLPLERFLEGGFSRQPYRLAMAGILPESIRWRDSKYVPMPDLPVNLASAKPGLLARLEAVREAPTLREIFDFDAIAAALHAAPEGAEAERAVLALNADGPVAPAFRRAMAALRALTLARQMVRLQETAGTDDAPPRQPAAAGL